MKAALRKQMLKNRNALFPEQRKLWDEQICRRLIQYDKEFPCPVYLCYVSYKSEVSTKEFILWCLEQGKSVFVPKVMEKRKPEVIRAGNARIKDMAASVSEKAKIRDMAFYQISAWEELQAGYQGILEPDALPEGSFSERILNLDVQDQHFRMLLPGAVFDRQGNRIGYGGGFYDRWLARWDQTDYGKRGSLEKIGLAYHIQVADRIPVEEFDQKVDCVMTEEYTIKALAVADKNVFPC